MSEPMPLHYRLQYQEFEADLYLHLSFGNSIVKGLMPKASSFRSDVHEKLEEEHCTNFPGMWAAFENVRQMARDRDSSVQRFGPTWDCYVDQLNLIHPQIFGDLYCQWYINRDVWLKSIKKNLFTAMSIVRGRKEVSTTFNALTDEKLKESHCQPHVWKTLENIRKMAKRSEDGGQRDVSIARFGKEWWDKTMNELNRTEPAIFGDLYAQI